MSAFSKNLLAMRKLHEFSRPQMAAKLMLNENSYEAYEEGRTDPSFSVLLRICKVLLIEDIKSFMYQENFLARQIDEPKEWEQPMSKERDLLFSRFQLSNQRDQKLVRLILNIKEDRK